MPTTISTMTQASNSRNQLMLDDNQYFCRDIWLSHIPLRFHPLLNKYRLSGRDPVRALDRLYKRFSTYWNANPVPNNELIILFGLSSNPFKDLTWDVKFDINYMQFVSQNTGKITREGFQDITVPAAYKVVEDALRLYPKAAGDISEINIDEFDGTYKIKYHFQSLGSDHAIGAAWWAMLAGRILCGSTFVTGKQDIAELISMSRETNSIHWDASYDKARHIKLLKKLKEDPSSIPDPSVWACFGNGPMTTSDVFPVYKSDYQEKIEYIKDMEQDFTEYMKEI